MAPRRNPTDAEIAVQLDRERHIRFDLNALIAFEEVSGVDVLRNFNIDLMNLKTVRMLLWACLVHEEPELTLEQVGALIRPDTLRTITTELGRVMNAGLPAATVKEGNGSDPLAMKPIAQTTPG